MRFLPGLLLLLPLVSTYAQAELIDDVNDRGELRIALEANTPPFNFKDDGKLTGFEVELGQMLASELDVRADFVVTEDSDLLPGVESGKYDIAINHIALTPERKDRFDFSEPYSYSSADLVDRKKVARAPAEGSGILNGLDLLSDHPDAQRSPSPVSDRLVIPYALTDDHALTQKAAKTARTLSLAIPFQKGNPAFQASLDSALQRIKADGRLMALSEKWFGMDASLPPKP